MFYCWFYEQFTMCRDWEKSNDETLSIWMERYWVVYSLTWSNYFE